MHIRALPFPDQKKLNKKLKVRLRRMYPLYFFLLPAVAATLVFTYSPMFINVVAFMEYDLTEGWLGLGSKFIGLQNFKFVMDPWFWKLLLRTFNYSFWQLVFSFPASLVLALLINEIKNIHFKKISQTISYIPHFVSWVTVAGLFYIFLSIDPSGVINNIKQFIFGGDRIIFFQEQDYFLPILVISQLWKEVGWGTILYLAAMAGLDQELYEAARIDGASRLKQALFITLPGILPTTAILLIFALGGLGGVNFDQIFNFSNPVLASTVETINLYVYRTGVKNMQYAIATAVGLFQGLIAFILIQLANFGSKKLAGVGFF